MVTTGQVDRMTWWNGTETMAREPLELAMLRVKRRETARRVRWERRFSGVKVRWPVPIKMKQPIEVAVVCDVVSSHGRLSWRIVSKIPWLEKDVPSTEA
jgi:hypothetical protein